MSQSNESIVGFLGALCVTTILCVGFGLWALTSFANGRDNGFVDGEYEWYIYDPHAVDGITRGKAYLCSDRPRFSGSNVSCYCEDVEGQIYISCDWSAYKMKHK